MPATSEKQRRLMAAARSYKRGEYKGKASAKIKELAGSMSDKDLTDFMHKKGSISIGQIKEALDKEAAKGDMLKKLLSALDGRVITGVDSRVSRSLNLPGKPTGGDISKAITDKVRHHTGEATNLAKATFSPAATRKAVSKTLSVPDVAVDTAGSGLASLVKTLKRHMPKTT